MMDEGTRLLGWVWILGLFMCKLEWICSSVVIFEKEIFFNLSIDDRPLLI